MKNIFEQRVFYSDTDSYGVVWHGSYLRWLEMGRVYWTEMKGLSLIDLVENQDITLHVTTLRVKYKSSARLDDIVVVETEVASFNGLTAVFKQFIKSKETGKTFVEAEVSVVAINNSGKLYRRMPQILAEKFDEELKCPALV